MALDSRRGTNTGAPAPELIIAGACLLGARPVDLHIAGGVITEIRASDTHTRCATGRHLRLIDAAGLIALPAFVDLHTHLREPGEDEAETIATGTRSAAAGGYSDVFAMANTDPVTDTAQAVALLRDRATKSAHCRVHPVGALTIGLHGTALAPMAQMSAAGVRVFSDDGHCLDDAVLMRRALHEAAQLGVVVAQHAQHAQLAGDGQINAGPAAQRTGLTPWPGVAEETVIARDVILAAEAGAHLHVCHLSTRRAVQVVRWAKTQGWNVTAEVAPHHLLLDDEIAATTGNPAYKVNPPLRCVDDVNAVREGLIDGTIDAVATDHAPHTAQSKAQPWCQAPFGFAGLETAFAATAHALTAIEALDWSLVSSVMSHSPARIGGIAAFAGRPLAVGEPATLALIDPNADWTVSKQDRYTRSSNNPLAGSTFTHRVRATLMNGKLIHSIP